MSQCYPYGEPQATGLIRQNAEDFSVDEVLGFEPDGAGEHLFIRVEKRGLSTPELIERIARVCGLHPRHIGYSGLKDKHALTRQWLSLHLPGRPDPESLVDTENYRILDRARHHGKLRRGTHRHNIFALRVRELKGFAGADDVRLRAIGAQGFANYFGRQRFGRHGDNVEQALSQLGRRKLPRQRQSLLISALRSFLFNQVLQRRVASHDWREPLDGDLFMLDGSHSLFSAALDDEVRARFAGLDIHPSASLYGAGENRLRGDALALEQRVIGEYPDIVACLDRIGVKRQMRALRARAAELDYEYDATARVLRLGVTLPAGSYLTSLLDHCVLTREPSQSERR